MSSTVSQHDLPAPSERRAARKRRADAFPADRHPISGRSRLGCLTGVRIAATGSYLPDTIVTNRDLAKLGYDEQWIVQRTGIHERRHAPVEMATSDIAYEAAIRCLESASVSPGDVDLIVVATMTPDSPMPTTACLLQERLGCIAPAMEVNAACAGFMYALVTGMQYVKTGCSRLALVVGADLMSRAVNPADARTFPLFGDGAGAVLLTAGEEDQGLLSFTLGSEGDAVGVLCQPAGGTREPLSTEALAAGRQFIHMEGRSVFKWAVRVLIDSTRDVLSHAGLNHDDVDVAVLHQANVRIIESAIEDLGIERSKVLVNLDRYGNTSAASMPLVLDEACRDSRIRRGDRVLLNGFGGGLSWGSAVMRW
jgi:3-oxoacyl-[acyl-carrier-protein] synthase-3